MKRMGGWLSAKTPLPSSSSTRSLTALDEPHALREALAAAAHILNDDVDLAEAELAKGTSPFHKLGRATTTFLRATLGFEKEVIEQANIRLSEAEESALDHQKRAIRDPSTAHQSAIYPVGSEYALCHAETQLMSAVVAVLNESLTESLRGFYKLRKAFQTLYEISEAERKYIEAKGISGKAGRSKTSVATFDTGTTLAASESSGTRTPKDARQDADDDSDLEFEDASEDRSDQPTPTEYQGHLEMPDLSKLDMKEKDIPPPNGGMTGTQQATGVNVASAGAAAQAENDVDFRDVSTDEIDLFIHSGTALCYGLLQLLLSMIPPTFAKLLSLFSFKGDRTNGLRLLWSATRFKTNINGGMASLITLGFHNGAIAFCDILSADALPKERLSELLREMRQLYPKSKLWLLEEARELSAAHQLQKAVDITAPSDSPSPLKQVEALRTFERSLNLMYLHRYEDCAASFLKCIELNNWSHALYYYIAGACHLELYRQHKRTGSKEAAKHASRAEELFKIVPSHTGKKKFMARQLPFDVFTSRKLAKWTARSEQRGCAFVDAIGVSPLEEMIYFWSGYRRMAAPQLQDSLAALTMSPTASETGDTTASAEPQDEQAVTSLLTATVHRFLGDLPTAKTFLQKVLPLSQAALRSSGGAHADSWPAPVSHYEMAVVYWEEAGRETGDRVILEKCSDELKLVENSEAFDLDARVGLKVTTGRETLRRVNVGP